MIAKMLNPYDWPAEGNADVDEDPEGQADQLVTPPPARTPYVFVPWEALVEHYGPGPHKSGSPQSSHASGGVGRATSATMAGIEQGGSSVRTSGATPSSGIMVSYPPGSGHNSVIDATAPRAQVEAQVRAFVEQQRAFVTSKSDRYIGGWVDAGKLHLDVSQNFPSSRREAALRAGRERNQIAVFDLDTFTDIPTGGTGMERLAAST